MIKKNWEISDLFPRDIFSWWTDVIDNHEKRLEFLLFCQTHAVRTIYVDPGDHIYNDYGIITGNPFYLNLIKNSN